MVENILLVGSICTAVLAFIGVVAKLIHMIIKLTKMVKDVLEKTDKNYMNNLKLVIMSDEMPIEERLRAGKEYVSHDGNGQVKAYYHKLKLEYEKNVKIS